MATMAESPPPAPLLLELNECLRVVTHFFAMAGPTVRMSTSDWQHVRSFVAKHPKAMVTVQYEVLSSIVPVVMFEEDE